MADLDEIIIFWGNVKLRLMDGIFYLKFSLIVFVHKSVHKGKFRY